MTLCRLLARDRTSVVTPSWEFRVGNGEDREKSGIVEYVNGGWYVVCGMWYVMIRFGYWYACL